MKYARQIPRLKNNPISSCYTTYWLTSSPVESFAADRARPTVKSSIVALHKATISSSFSGYVQSNSQYYRTSTFNNHCEEGVLCSMGFPLSRCEEEVEECQIHPGSHVSLVGAKDPSKTLVVRSVLYCENSGIAYSLFNGIVRSRDQLVLVANQESK